MGALRLLLAIAAIGCNSAAAPAPVARPRAAEPAARAADPTPASSARPPAAAATADAREPVLLVTDPAALDVVARAGGDFGVLVAARDTAGANNAELAAAPAYRSIIDAVASDVDAVARADHGAGVGIRGHVHRLFDLRWLRAQSARFELVAVVNRLDRRPFNPSACGETRLVYRLAYARTEGAVVLASRLPMTLIAELSGPAPDAVQGCQPAAQRWLAAPGLAGRALGERLVSAAGPLAPELLARERLVQVAINVQTVRWPSTARPDLAGHAEYVLRAFAWDSAQRVYRPRRLENTPDVSRLQRDGELRAALRAWIAAPANLARVDTATALIPEQFLAESITSVTPRGLARRHNRPFRRLFEPAEFADLAYAGLRHARSPEALVRRLDDLTCNGCHQSRSIAGFHLLGEDGPEAAAGNALATPQSPHARMELARRKPYVLALARGLAADEARPFAEHAGPDDSGYGAHCGLGDPGFADWQCAAGLKCDPYESAIGETTIGICLPPTPRVGDPCQVGRVAPHDDPHRDRVRDVEQRNCDFVCESSRVGFPGGMCAASCSDLPEDGACGGIAILTDFNNCLARRAPFAQCATDHVRPAGLRACSADEPCRDDYVCARAGSGAGACLPPYFVFQLRVDGHP